MSETVRLALGLLPFIALVAAAAMTGAMFQPGPWYASLSKPWWTPPNWAFPVVWTTLYIMIAAAGWLVWRAEGVGLALVLWVAQLVFNAAWSWIMFSRREIALALVDAVAMWVAILAFIIVAWPVSRTVSLLFLPYMAWVSTAIALNWAVLARNPQA